MNYGKILIAEDDEDIVGLLKLYLEKDYKIISVNNGEDALEVINTENISLAILDIMMPKLNGYELTKKIREISTLPILILSAKIWTVIKY